jgi:hypothetical protein
MKASCYIHRPARNIALLAFGGAIGALIVLYSYLLLYLLFSPRPNGAVLAPSLFPAVADWVLASVMGVAWVAALFGAAALTGLAYLAVRLPVSSSLRFGAGSALLLAALSYPIALASDRLLGRAFHTHPSLFVVIAGCGFVGGVFVHRHSLRHRASVA